VNPGGVLTFSRSRFQATSELAATYAALILADEGIEITVRPVPSTQNPHIQDPNLNKLFDLNSQADKIVALTDAAGVECEPIWAALLTKALEGKNVKELLSNVGSGGGGPAQVVAAGGATGGAPAAAAEEEEKKEEEKEESDEDMVCFLLSACDLFD